MIAVDNEFKRINLEAVQIFIGLQFSLSRLRLLAFTFFNVNWNCIRFDALKYASYQQRVQVFHLHFKFFSQRNLFIVFFSGASSSRLEWLSMSWFPILLWFKNKISDFQVQTDATFNKKWTQPVNVSVYFLLFHSELNLNFIKSLMVIFIRALGKCLFIQK